MNNPDSGNLGSTSLAYLYHSVMTLLVYGLSLSSALYSLNTDSMDTFLLYNFRDKPGQPEICQFDLSAVVHQDV